MCILSLVFSIFERIGISFKFFGGSDFINIDN